jgi:hypothetical protein
MTKAKLNQSHGVDGELGVPSHDHWEELESLPVDAAGTCANWRETRKVGIPTYILTTSLKNQHMFCVLRLIFVCGSFQEIKG